MTFNVLRGIVGTFPLGVLEYNVLKNRAMKKKMRVLFENSAKSIRSRIASIFCMPGSVRITFFSHTWAPISDEISKIESRTCGWVSNIFTRVEMDIRNRCYLIHTCKHPRIENWTACIERSLWNVFCLLEDSKLRGYSVWSSRRCSSSPFDEIHTRCTWIQLIMRDSISQYSYLPPPPFALSLPLLFLSRIRD